MWLKLKHSLADSLESFPWSASIYSFTGPHRKAALKNFVMEVCFFSKVAALHCQGVSKKDPTADGFLAISINQNTCGGDLCST